MKDAFGSSVTCNDADGTKLHALPARHDACVALFFASYVRIYVPTSTRVLVQWRDYYYFIIVVMSLKV